MPIVEAKAHRGKLVDIGRRDQFTAGDADIAQTNVGPIDDDDIWFAGSGLCSDQCEWK